MALSVHAADTVELLSWSNAVRETSTANRALLAAKETLLQADAHYRKAVGADRPTLDTGAGAAYAQSHSSGRTDSGDAWSADLSSSYTLADGGATRARIQSARLSEQRARASFRKEAARIGAELSRSFTKLAYAQAEVDLLANIAERRAQNSDLVQLRYEGGKENLGSQLRSKAVYEDAVQSLASSRRALVAVRRELALTLARPPDTELQVEGFAPTSPVPATVSFDELARTAPDYAMKAADRAMAREEVKIARSAFRPDWSLGVSAGIGGADPRMDESSNWRAGIKVSYPVYRGYQDHYALVAAQSAEREAQLRSEQTLQDVYLNLEATWIEARNALERERVRESFLNAAEVRAEISRCQYASGLIGYQDWDQIEDEVINARKALLAARRDAVLATVAWMEAQGQSPLELP